MTWACERFSEYLIGLRFHIETDHKPLVPLFSSKLLDELPLRVQQFRMRMMRYNFTINHVPGKSLTTADTLTRAPISEPNSEDVLLQDESDAYIQIALQNIPASRLDEIRKLQQEDQISREVISHCRSGWPEKHQLYGPVRSFYPVAAQLSVENELLMNGNRLVIPSVLQKEILEILHKGHQGMTKCKEMAKQAVWWPGIGRQIEETVKNCKECCKYQFQKAEHLISTALPDRPWQRVATDLFEWKKANYLFIIDYYSRWIEIAKLERTNADNIIAHTKSIFARYGIPETVISDNGPQYSSEAYSTFSKQYGFQHITSSPYHPQGTGEAERGVQTMKSLLRKAADPYMAMLVYCSTPLEMGYSPAELLMGRRLRTTLPMVPEQLVPKPPPKSIVKNRDTHLKERHKDNFDNRRGVKELPALSQGDSVWVPDRQSSGEVIEHVSPRSYVIQTPEGSFRRNRRQITSNPDTEMNLTLQTDHSSSPIDPGDLEGDNVEPQKVYLTRSKSGHLPKTIDRLGVTSYEGRCSVIALTYYYNYAYTFLYH